jgi:PAS domain S-box-containing protein
MAARQGVRWNMSRFLPLTLADWARIAVLAGLYVALGKLSFSLAVASDYVALTVFIPAGIALAFAIHYGYRVWPGIFIGQWLLLIVSGQSFATGLPVAAGNSIEAVLGVWLFQRFRLQCAFERQRDVSGLILLSALVLQPISATLGTLPLWLDSRINVTEWMPLWASWWLANVMAQLLFTPLLLTWFSANAAGQPQRLSRLRTALPVSLLAIAVGLLVFGRLGMNIGSANHLLAFAYCFPFMIFVGIVWGVRGATLAAVLIAGLAIDSTLAGIGAFVYVQASDRVLDINIFIIGVALVGLYVGTLFAERKTSEARLRSSERLLSATLENSPNVAVQWYDGEGRVRYWNRASERIFGWTAEQAIGQTLDRLIFSATDTRTFQATLAQIGATGEVVGPSEFSVRHRDGRQRVISSTTFAIPGDNAPIFVCMDVDITERKQTEESLRASESLFRLLLESSPLPILVTGANQRLIVLNRRFVETFGYTLPEMPEADNWWSLACPDADYRYRLRQEWERQLAAVATSGAVFSLEAVVACRDGRSLPIEVFTSATEQFSVMVFRDLTQKMQAEVELKSVSQDTARALSLMEATLDATDNGILVVDFSGKVTSANKRFAQMWHVPDELLASSDDRKILAHVVEQLQEPERFMHKVEALYAQPETIARDTLRFRDGRVFARSSRPQTLDGRVVGRVWSFLDITDQQRAEQRVLQLSQAITQELKRAELQREQLQSLLSAIPDPVWMKGPDGTYLSSNRAFEKMTGVPSAQVLGHTDFDFFAPELAEQFRADDQVVAQSLVSISHDESVTFAGDSQPTLLETVKTAVRGQEGRLIGVLGIARNVTRARTLLDDVEKARVAAQEANASKSMFLASMSHELRTPLNAIIGFAQMLDMGVPSPLDPAQKEAVGHILGSGRHLLGLINGVLDLTRIEAGKLDLAIQTMALGPVIAEAISLITPAAENRQIVIRQTCNNELQIVADASRVRQILLNLLSNAVKYNREGGMILVSCQALETTVRITVVDTGQGIAEPQRAQVFQPFQRLGAERTATEGTGIGLVICKKIAEAMHGAIGFHSQEGIGSRFWVELPAVRVEQEAPPVVTTIPFAHSTHSAPIDNPDAPLAAPNVGVQGRVLYVEDNPGNLAVMKHLFLLLPGVHLQMAENAEKGLAMIRENPPDLVLMDINLPGMSGQEALKILKSDPLTAAIPVIAVSAAALPHDVNSGLNAGFLAYLTKPFNVDTLLDQVREILKNKPLPEDPHG